jgi:hypothetical protein
VAVPTRLPTRSSSTMAAVTSTLSTSVCRNQYPCLVDRLELTSIDANDYGKVYRSCGNCKGNSKCKRSVHMEGVTAVNGGELIGINTNLGDKVSCSS